VLGAWDDATWRLEPRRGSWAAHLLFMNAAMAASVTTILEQDLFYSSYTRLCFSNQTSFSAQMATSRFRA
jgi:hypothetical protein